MKATSEAGRGPKGETSALPAPEGLRATPLDLCKCGHSRERHYMLLVPGNATPGACSASVDKRHVTAGGPDLSPCDCQGFEPMSFETGIVS